MRRFGGDRLLVATHNAGKLAEIAAMLQGRGIDVVGAADRDLPEPEETGENFVENARIKAHAAATATGLPALADDSGLEIAALGGAPGVRTADWAETPQGRDFPMAMRKIHEKLLTAGKPEPWLARFCCVFVLAWPDGADAVFEGEVPGRFVWPMRGQGGHGYDPCFQPDGHDLTFAEMTPEAKNAISHRAAAFRKLQRVFP